MDLIVDARFKYNYFSYYLLGVENLQDVHIIYDSRPFLSLPYSNIRDYNLGTAIIVKKGDDERRVFICFEDVARIDETRYNWCDVYAMVNPTEEQVREYEKLLPIGPEFGLTLGSKCHSLCTFIKRYLDAKNFTSISPKIYLRDYLYTNIRRRPLSQYEERREVKNNYVFHASTLWYNDFAATDTNMYRGEFLKACQKAGLNIEGGLFYINSSEVVAEMPDYPKYKDIYKDFIYESRLSMDDYIQKTKESVVVFNTPSVCGCHGWKLGEYLCMGKAIISSPLSRVMPGEGLTHGVNVHFVQSPEEILEAVAKISKDEEYRRTLEHGARVYYEKYLAPEVVIKRIIEKACS